MTGLDYAVNRYYSSQWGRFLSPDPYLANNGGAGDPADPGSWNRYAYARNDPVNYTDPAGTNRVVLVWSPTASFAQFWTAEEWMLGTFQSTACFWSNQGGLLDFEGADVGAGSGGGPDFSAQMRNQMRQAVLGLGPGCQTALGNVDLAIAAPVGTLGSGQVNLLTALGDTDGMNFFEVAGPQGQLTLSQAGILDLVSGTAYAGDPTLAAYFGDQTKTVAETINNSILLGSLFFSEAPGEQNVTLVHEGLHAIFGGTTVGGTDADVANYFNLPCDRTLRGDALVTAAGQAISAWLRTDCGGRQ